MEELFKFLSLVAGIIATAVSIHKGFAEAGINNQSRLREEFRFSKEFIDLLNQSQSHPFLIEQGYLAIYGKRLNANEIKHLLSFPNPSKILRDYTLAKYYLQYSDRELQYKPKYRSKHRRDQTKKINLVGYSVFAVFALLPVVFSNLFKNISFSLVVAIGIWIFALGFPAWLFLNSYSQIAAAERVIEEDRKRASQTIEEEGSCNNEELNVTHQRVNSSKRTSLFHPHLRTTVRNADVIKVESEEELNQIRNLPPDKKAEAFRAWANQPRNLPFYQNVDDSRERIYAERD